MHTVELELDGSANKIHSKLDQEKYRLSQLHQDNVDQAEVSSLRSHSLSIIRMPLKNIKNLSES